MENLKRLSEDITVAIDSLNYETQEEQKIKKDILLNINRLLNEEYIENIKALSSAKYIEPADSSFFDDIIFTKVAYDVMVAICSLKYQDKSINEDRLELVISISRFILNQKAYYNNIRILDELEKTKGIQI